MTLALALSALVFLVLTIIFAISAADRYGRLASRRLRNVAWTSLGLSSTLFLVAIWYQALTTGG